MLKVAMLSKWHVHAKDYQRQLLETGKAEIVAVWDEDPTRGKIWAEEMGAAFYASIDELLTESDAEAVVIVSPTNMHLELITKAAAAGKHIYTEKTLGITKADAEMMAKAVEEAGVIFTISMPQLVSPEIQYIKNAIDGGLLGDITMLRIRNAHNGAVADWLPSHWYDAEKAGGGAMIDLGCHPVYQANWLLGVPKKVNAIINTITNREVDDNAMMTVEYENKAIAILETSFVSYKSPRFIEVYGTQGTILWSGDGIFKIMSSKIEGAEQSWITPADLPEAIPTPITQFVEAILQNDPSLVHTGLSHGIALSDVLEKAYIANAEGRTVEF
ncbi:MAG: Gfo/Idh/MocA family oxidoreductase [Anaerolineaceae bacterium]|nr:Gfo/Idh/MocA family oxidoreductase [Anaerolineaceae bacterium]